MISVQGQPEAYGHRRIPVGAHPYVQDQSACLSSVFVLLAEFGEHAMTQANEYAKTVITMTPSGVSQQGRSWFSRHTQEVSDASLAQFERLMAAMGYRRLGATDRRAA